MEDPRWQREGAAALVEGQCGDTKMKMPTWKMIRDGREKAKPTLVRRLAQMIRRQSARPFLLAGQCWATDLLF